MELVNMRLTSGRWVSVCQVIHNDEELETSLANLDDIMTNEPETPINQQVVESISAIIVAYENAQPEVQHFISAASSCQRVA